MISAKGLVHKGQELARANDRGEARVLPTRAVELDPRKETAWLLPSRVVDTDKERQTRLQRALSVHHSDAAAGRGLEALGQRITARSGISRTQWTAMAALSAGVVMVFSCLGCLLVDVMSPVSMPLLRPSPQPSPTPTLARSGTVDDMYEECLLAILPEASQLSSDVADLCEAGDIGVVCQSATGWAERVERLRAEHSRCPLPGDAHLLRVRFLVGSALLEEAGLIEAMRLFCSGGEVDRLYEALDKTVCANELWTQANAELDLYAR
jgi:hypothetical protein